MNKEKEISDDEQGTVRAIREGVPLLRSLFIDGQRAHARLRLLLNQTVDVPSRDFTPALAMLMARPLASGLDDLAPRDGDLVPFTFRLLSAAYLGSAGYHLDFSREGVLERALSLFLEPTAEGSARQSPLVVVRDHSFNIEDRIGLVRNARWSPVLPLSSGSPGLASDGTSRLGLRPEEQSLNEHTLPFPGIDAELHINWKLAGEVVRRLLHNPPLLDACSVSLGFGWEKSHPNLEDQQFWMRLGEEVDGSLVRVVVTEILSVEHIGLVFAGADRSARRIIPPTKQQEQTVPESEADFDRDLPADKIPRQTAMTACLASEPTDKTSIKGGNPFMEKKNITITSDSPLLGLLGVKELDLALIEQRAGDLKHLAELGCEALADLRREVEALIVQLDGAAESEPSLGLLKVVQAADVATLKALKNEYIQRLENLVPACCQVCGSEQISRRSSREISLTGRNHDRDDPGLYR